MGAYWLDNEPSARALVPLLGVLGCVLVISCRGSAPQDPDDGAGAGGTAGTGGVAGTGAGGPGAPGGDAGSGPMAMDPLVSQSGSERGAGCSVKNDCAEGFSCIRGVCQSPSFPFEATGKECFQIDCTQQEDCCGNLETDIPEKCRGRAAKCLDTLPGCSATECTRSSDCLGGGLCVGHCSVSSGECSGSADCLENKCINARCSLDFTDCDSDAACAPNSCVGGSCDCTNPSYDPSAPVCEDEDCEGLCSHTCENSRCVIPSDCESREDCFGSTSLCDEGKCVQCASSNDCSFGKICLQGRCETACQDDNHCPLFEACQAGQCIYVGCRSHRECSLIPNVEAIGLPSGVDPRLLRCNTEQGIGKCIIPCQTDAQCPSSEVCEGGVCEYIGCETSAECKTIVGLHNQESSGDMPWVTVLECRAPEE